MEKCYTNKLLLEKESHGGISIHKEHFMGACCDFKQALFCFLAESVILSVLRMFSSSFICYGKSCAVVLLLVLSSVVWLL